MANSTAGLVVSVISVLLALVSFAYTLMSKRQERQRSASLAVQVAVQASLDKLHAQAEDTEKRLALLEVKIGLFMRLIEEHLSTMLKP